MCMSDDWSTGGADTEVNEERDPMNPIVDMLLLTNLAERLGIPCPAECDQDWASPEYLLWILWRCDALAPRDAPGRL